MSHAPIFWGDLQIIYCLLFFRVIPEIYHLLIKEYLYTSAFCLYEFLFFLLLELTSLMISLKAVFKGSFFLGK